ncbi:MAG: PorT family protein [Chlorobi bacterium]|nr:PorT family protein [Chlorobiota bacterium]
MKKSIILILIFSGLLSFSQEFSGGMFGGFTASQVDGDGYGGYNKPGAILGAFVSRKINSDWNWQMELLYAQRGSKKNMQPQKGDYIFYKMHLEYLEIPLVLTYSYSSSFSFEGGFSVGRLVRWYEENEREIFYSNPFYKYAISSIIGVRYTLTDKIKIGLRETYSLRPIRGYSNGGRWWYKIGQFSNSLSFVVYYEI